MNKIEFENIKNIITNDIKPVDCKLIYLDKQDLNNPSCYYDDYSKTCYFYILDKSYEEQLHSILHEICHYLTWKELWRIKQYKGYSVNYGIYKIYKRKSVEYKSVPTKYLSEYLAEKLLRKICKKYNWSHILNISNSWVKRLIKKRKTGWIDFHDYIYAAKRIKREENL